MKNGILAGLRVIEVSAFVAAPMAGATLASMGADVIRIEQRGGGIDAHRWPLHDGRSLYRAGLDQGKRSVTVDLRSVTGQELATNLIVGGGPDGGILVTNLATKGWMAYERIAEKRPNLIMLAIVGSPGGGAAVDYTINAGVGFPWVTGPEDWKGPVNHVLPAWDLTTGLLAASAVLAAERHRRLTGEGQLVEIALSDVAIAVAGHLGFLAEAKLNAEPRGRFGNDLYGTYARDFRSADGTHIMVCALTPRQWTSLASATRLTEAFKELEAKHRVDLTDEGSRFVHRRQISALLEPWIAARSLAEVGEAFDAAGVLWGPYRTFQELVRDDPQAAEPYASAISFGAFERTKAAAGPDIGADTADVLSAELGLTEDEIAALRAQAVID
jgi:2-methylfumaryl-CoA isomerase